MPTIAAALQAAAQARAKRALAVGQKSIVRGGPLLQRAMVGRPLTAGMAWTTEQAVERYYKLSALVYRAATSLASAVGSVRWQVEVKTADRWELAEGHELQALLDQPHKAYNRQMWNEAMCLYLALSGNAINAKTLASGRAQGAKKGRILEMVPLIPDGINPVPDDEEWISRYEFKGPPKRVWPAEEILHIMFPDPGNPYWGMSPLLSARSIIRMDLAAIDWNSAAMQNRAISDGVFSLETPLNSEQYEEIKDQIWEQHQGPQNAHEPWVLGAGAKWQPMERTPVEMDFNATRMRTREEILSSLGIPPVVAGYFENATLANADVSRRIFWEDRAVPDYVERITGALNGGVVPHFGDVARLRVSYDISGIPALRDDLVKKSVCLRNFVATGVPYNHAIDELELDLEPIETWGDIPFGLELMGKEEEPETDDEPGGEDQLPPDGAGDPTGDQPPEKRAPAIRRQRKTSVTVNTDTFATAVADEEAPAIRRAFLAEIAKLRQGASLEELAAIVRSGDVGAAIAKLGGHRMADRLLESVGKLIEVTARRGVSLATEKLSRDIGVDLALDQSRFKRWLVPYLGERTQQLTTTTEKAARDFFFDLAAGKLGEDRDAAAKLLESTWGLHSQQAAGVRNVYGSLLAGGKDPVKALETATRLAGKRLNERAQLMAEHESLVAANRGNGLAFEQALAEGAASQITATWFAEEDADTDEECAYLDGQEINVGAGELFVGLTGKRYLEPPAPHPGCRCGVIRAAIA